MPAISPPRRTLFRLLKIARGETLEATIGHEVTVARVHWTPSGPRECQNHDGRTHCVHCADAKASEPREVIYATAYTDGDQSPFLLILSTIAVQWATDTEDLVRARLIIRRAAKNNLIRATHAGPAARATPIAPLDQWIQTLWGSAK